MAIFNSKLLVYQRVDKQTCGEINADDWLLENATHCV